jgi:hypothetical protein
VQAATQKPKQQATLNTQEKSCAESQFRADDSGCQCFPAEQTRTSSSSPLMAKLDFNLLRPFFEVRICSAENFDRLAELTRTSSATFPSQNNIALIHLCN